MKIYEGYFNDVEQQDINSDDFNQDSGTEDIESLCNYQYHLFIGFTCSYTDSNKLDFDVIKNRLSLYLERFPLVYELSQPVVASLYSVADGLQLMSLGHQGPMIVIGFNAKFKTSKSLVVFFYKALPIVCKGFEDSLELNEIGCLDVNKSTKDYNINFIFMWYHIRSKFLNQGIKNNWFKCFKYFGLTYNQKNIMPVYKALNASVDDRLKTFYENDVPSGYKFLQMSGLLHNTFVVNSLTEKQFIHLGYKPTFYSEPSFSVSMVLNGFGDMGRLYHYFIENKNSNTIGTVLLFIYKRGKKFTLITTVTFSEGCSTNDIQYYTPTILNKYENIHNHELEKIKALWIGNVLAPLFYAGNSVASIIDALWDIIQYDFMELSKDDVIKEIEKYV